MAAAGFFVLKHMYNFEEPLLSEPKTLNLYLLK